MAVLTMTRYRVVLLLCIATSILMIPPMAAAANVRQAVEEAPGFESPLVGLVGPGSYESPQFGHVIEWDTQWDADLEATESNREIALDRLSIVAGDARFQVFHIAADGESAADYAERFFAYRSASDPTLNVTATGERRGVTWAAYTYDVDGFLTFGVVEISLVGAGSTIRVVEVMANRDQFDQTFATAMETILVDGELPFRVLRGWPE